MKLLPLLRSSVAALALTCGAAQAGVVFQLDANGELTGAQGVLVNGGSYDVEFKEGSCYALYDLCTNSTQFVFNTAAAAQAASEALLSQVFVGLYDTDPTQLAVIPWFQTIINAITPYAMGSGATSGRVLVSVVQNGADEIYDEVIFSNIGTTSSTFVGSADFFAVWSPSSVGTGGGGETGGGTGGGTGGQGGTVPEPGTLALAGLSLVWLYTLRRRSA